jgi:hypothetical protein
MAKQGIWHFIKFGNWLTIEPFSDKITHTEMVIYAIKYTRILRRLISEG